MKIFKERNTSRDGTFNDAVFPECMRVWVIQWCSLAVSPTGPVGSYITLVSPTLLSPPTSSPTCSIYIKSWSPSAKFQSLPPWNILTPPNLMILPWQIHDNIPVQITTPFPWHSEFYRQSSWQCYVLCHRNAQSFHWVPSHRQSAFNFNHGPTCNSAKFISEAVLHAAILLWTKDPLRGDYLLSTATNTSLGWTNTSLYRVA